jgi:hypothetical protein
MAPKLIASSSQPEPVDVGAPKAVFDAFHDPVASILVRLLCDPSSIPTTDTRTCYMAIDSAYHILVRRPSFFLNISLFIPFLFQRYTHRRYTDKDNCFVWNNKFHVWMQPINEILERAGPIPEFWTDFAIEPIDVSLQTSRLPLSLSNFSQSSVKAPTELPKRSNKNPIHYGLFDKDPPFDNEKLVPSLTFLEHQKARGTFTPSFYSFYIH